MRGLSSGTPASSPFGLDGSLLPAHYKGPTTYGNSLHQASFNSQISGLSPEQSLISLLD